MTALGDYPQAYGHFLHIVGDRDQNQKKPDKVIAIFCASGGVGGYAPGIIVSDHDHKARAGNKIDLKCLPIFLNVEALAKPIKANGINSLKVKKRKFTCLK